MKKSILEAVHETAKDLHESGLMNLQTMREFDALCLPACAAPVESKENQGVSFASRGLGIVNVAG